jgi:twitching motility two-component system response regulator PilG
MPSKTYESDRLISTLDSLFKDDITGTFSIKTNIISWQKQRFCVLVVRDGKLLYGGSHVPSNLELCRWLGKSLKPHLIKAALSVAQEKMVDCNSTTKLVESLIKMRVFTWKEVETLMNITITRTLEKFLPYPGAIQWENGNIPNNFDLSYGLDRHGLDWALIQQELRQRQRKWQSFASIIPSMDAIPVVTPQQFKQISNPQVREHFESSVDGKNSLVDIAEKIGKDPLSIAKSYTNWANNGWVGFQTSSSVSLMERADSSTATVKKVLVSSPAVHKKNQANLPTVLSVDDSPIVQTTIKRALKEQYNVLLADGATKALEILEQNSVDLLLLDLTMPEMDGLDFCRIVRQIPDFQDLPIVMVTARDGLVNKMKGHIAGTSKYLTKPFSPDELRETVHQYINSR